MAVQRDVQRFIVVQEFDDVGGCRSVDDAGGDELVHCFVVGGVGGVVDETRAADVDAAAEEGHAEGFVVRDALEGADHVGAFEVLGITILVSCDKLRVEDGWSYLGIMRPQISQLIQHFHFSKWT